LGISAAYNKWLLLIPFVCVLRRLQFQYFQRFLRACPLSAALRSD